MKRAKLSGWFFLALYAALLYTAISHLPQLGRATGWLWGVCGPVIRGLALAFVANILVRFLEDTALKRLGKSPRARRYLAIGITFILGMAMLALISSVVVPALLDALRMADAWLVSGQTPLVERLAELLRKIGAPESQVESLLGRLNAFSRQALDFVTTQASALTRAALDVTGTVLGGTFSAILSLVVALYALLSREWLAGACQKLALAVLPEKASRETLDIFHRLNLAFQGFIRGQILEGIILGSLCYLGMRAFRMPYASVISVVIGVTSLIPVLGAWGGAAFGGALILTESPATALWFLVFLFTLQQLEDNIVYPRVVGDSVGLPSLLVLAAIFVGGNAMGVAGMILAVPVAAVAWQRFMLRLYPGRQEAQKTPRKEIIHPRRKKKKG